jgi:choline dehydrogenase
VFSPASYKQGFVGLLDDFPGMTAGVWQHRPESVGYVRARSADPFQDPIIQPNYLADPIDRIVLLGGMKLARRCCNRRRWHGISTAIICRDRRSNLTTS